VRCFIQLGIMSVNYEFQVLILKNKVYSQHKKAEPDEVVEPEGFVFKHDEGKEGENKEGYHLLDHLQLPKVERASVALVTDAVGRHLKRIFEKCDSPTDEDDQRQSKAAEPGEFLHAQVTVPGQGHENIGNDKQADGGDFFHAYEFMVYWVSKVGILSSIFVPSGIHNVW
jgi:hypothetical protein